MYNEDDLGRIVSSTNGGEITMNTVCTEVSKFQGIMDIAKRSDNIYCTVGQHPLNYIGISELGLLLDTVVLDKKVVAVGEIGLDWHLEPSVEEKKWQEDAFALQMDFAKKNNLPVVMHSRPKVGEEGRFYDMVFSVIKEFDVRVVFHSFTGDLDIAKKIINMGHLVSFSGIVTFKNAVEIQKVASFVPEDRFIIETDGPFLTPEPYRGRRPNLPTNVRLVAEKIAELRKVSTGEIINKTTENARGIFKP